MDYSTHMQDFIQDKKIQIPQLLLYYTFHFLKRANLLIPLTLLISTIKVLTTFNSTRELVALQVSGIKIKRLLRPFFSLALICTLFNYANTQFFLPTSLNFIDRFYKAHLSYHYRNADKEPIHIVHLTDDSKLIYQAYDSAKETLFDVIWLRSTDDIWKMKFLKADPTNPLGEFTDHLQRSPQGLLVKTESYPSFLFKDLKWKKEQLNMGLVPIDNHSITSLLLMLQEKKGAKAEIITRLTFKCLMPLLPFLAVIACVPFCIRYARGLPLFFIYLIAVFGFLAFFAMMNAAIILGENNTIPSFWAIFIPFAFFFGAFSWKFSKIR
jgi:lipopolysaccharide export system permease protein